MSESHHPAAGRVRRARLPQRKRRRVERAGPMACKVAISEDGKGGWSAESVDTVAAPTVTADKVFDMLATASLSLEALRVVETMPSLLRAVQSVNAAYAYMAAYKATTTGSRPRHAKPTVQPLNDAAVLASMFGRHLDEEDVALEAAAAALGDAPGA